VRARDLDLSSIATAFSPALERAISPHACLVPCQRAHFRHNPLPGATFATRIPACMLTQSASCHRLLVRRKPTSQIKDRCNHRPHRDPSILTEPLSADLRRTRTGWLQSSSSLSSSTLAVDCFLRVVIEVGAHLQHTTARPAHMPRDPGASHARAHWIHCAATDIHWCDLSLRSQTLADVSGAFVLVAKEELRRVSAGSEVYASAGKCATATSLGSVWRVV
jgi:hypothetical protein